MDAAPFPWPQGADMHFGGDYAIHADPAAVYGVFVDPVRVVTFLPDVEVLELKPVDADTVRGRVKTGVSFLKGTFNVEARVVERDPPRRARMRVRSQGMGSTIDIDSAMDLRPSDEGTSVAWSADVAIRGTVATIGARLLPGLVAKKTTEFLDALRRDLER